MLILAVSISCHCVMMTYYLYFLYIGAIECTVNIFIFLKINLVVNRFGAEGGEDCLHTNDNFIPPLLPPPRTWDDMIF